MRYAVKWPVYAREWDEMKIVPSRVQEFKDEAQYAISHKIQYQEVQAASGVPWYHIAVIHRREADGNFGAYLGNGQPLEYRTTGVPEGRGPFANFRDGAVDALRVDGLTAVRDWCIEKILYYCELFNGTGYDSRGLPSPYLWGGTNIQKPGKYVADHKFDRRRLDPQPGCAPLLAMIAKLDPTVQLVRETP